MKIRWLILNGILLIMGVVCLTPQVGYANPVGDYNYVFENRKVLTFSIEMSGDAFQKMQPKRKDVDFSKMSSSNMFLQEFDYVPATVICDGAVYPEVGVRFRGNASITMIPPDGKKPFKLDFNRYVDSGIFHGFTTLNFINCFRDPSMLRDKLAYDLYRKAGVPAPRATFADVYLTLDGKPQEHLGFYVVVEQVNRPFLEDRFGNSKGLLLKFEITRDLEYRGEEWEKYAHDHELKSDNESDTKLFIQFVKFLTQSSDTEFAQSIERYLNLDRFLAWLALDMLLTDLDSYAGMGHNWYLYFNTDTERFEFIPWDVNESFGNLQMDAPDKMLNFDIKKPYVGDKILIRRILNIEKYRMLYEFYLRTFIRDFFNPEFLNREIDRLHAFIESAVKADSKPIFPYEDFLKSVNENVKPRMFILSQSIIGLKPFIEKRGESVMAQLVGTRQGDSIGDFMPGNSDQAPPVVPFGQNDASTSQEAGPAGAFPFPPQPPMTDEIRTQILSMKDTLQEINQSIEKDAGNAELYVRKGEILGKLIELVEPLEKMSYGMELGMSFEKAIELDPDSIGGHLGRGAVRFFTPEAFGGDLEGAITDIQFVLSKEPSNEQAHFFMGMIFQRKNQIEEAKASFQKVLEINPENQAVKELLKTLP